MTHILGARCRPTTYYSFWGKTRLKTMTLVAEEVSNRLCLVFCFKKKKRLPGRYQKGLTLRMIYSHIVVYH